MIRTEKFSRYVWGDKVFYEYTNNTLKFIDPEDIEYCNGEITIRMGRVIQKIEIPITKQEVPVGLFFNEESILLETYFCSTWCSDVSIHSSIQNRLQKTLKPICNTYDIDEMKIEHSDAVYALQFG